MKSEDTKKNEHWTVLLLSSVQSGRHRSASSILGTYVPFEVGTPTSLVRRCVRNYQQSKVTPELHRSVGTWIGASLGINRRTGTKENSVVKRVWKSAQERDGTSNFATNLDIFMFTDTKYFCHPLSMGKKRGLHYITILYYLTYSLRCMRA